MALQYDYSVSGVIAINTDVLGPTPVFDARSIHVRVLSLGTTGVLTVQGSEDGITYVNIPVMNTTGSVVNTITAIGTYHCPVYYNFIRVRLTTATTAGKTVVSTRLSTEPHVFPGPGTVAISGTVAVSGTTTVIQSLSPVLATGATLLYHRLVQSLASTNALLVKAGATRVARVVGYNAKATVVFLKLYNKASAPTVGTDVPVLTFALKPQFNFDISAEALGFNFATGCSYCITAGAADTDTTAIAAGDVLGLNIIYI